MTPDQKRAHLALHGCILLRYTPDPDGWRIVESQNYNRNRLVPPCIAWKSTLGLATSQWTIEFHLLGHGNQYTHHEFSDLPDELLDRLELLIIERFLNFNRRN